MTKAMLNGTKKDSWCDYSSLRFDVGGGTRYTDIRICSAGSKTSDENKC